MYYGFAPYVPVAKKLAIAKRYAANMHGNKVNPIVLDGNKIATTFWGQAWCNNLENYAELSNRLDRGRTYVRNGSVVHIEIEEGCVKSIVAGSVPYHTEIRIDKLKPNQWKSFKKKCSGEIGTVVELLQGKLSKNVLSLITNRRDGLFPIPKEIRLGCSCPDACGSWMCKHIAATLYGVGSLLDKSPELFFKLRGVDHLELIDTSVSITTGRKDSETLDDSSLEGIFGIELGEADEQPKPRKKVSGKPVKKATKKKSAKKTIKKTAKKTVTKIVKKTVKKAVKKTVKKTASKKSAKRKK
ncbi:MAG: hypothetical protein LBJ00_06855 [Planctomycetaceae bacterium]|jgi:uncharacterized Zn finger protein|nr:hypothetical protein [Planctomycetaceae bacterium]